MAPETPRSPSSDRSRSVGAVAAAALAALAAVTATPAAVGAIPPASSPEGPGVRVCRAGGAATAAWGLAALDPDRVEMSATRRARGGSGTLVLRLASSPTGPALAADGSYRYDVEVAVESLPPIGDGTYVVWAATPELDRHRKLGTVGRSGRVRGEIGWNKFLVFVTAEASAGVQTWSQSILLSARSPSGRMHTMAGHGPFSGEPCLDPRP